MKANLKCYYHFFVNAATSAKTQNPAHCNQKYAYGHYSHSLHQKYGKKVLHIKPLAENPLFQNENKTLPKWHKKQGVFGVAKRFDEQKA